jgi:hypothetical protein
MLHGKATAVLSISLSTSQEDSEPEVGTCTSVFRGFLPQSDVLPKLIVS